MLVISHDQHFVNSIAKELWVLQDRSLVKLSDFSQYRRLVQAKLDREAVGT